MSNFGGLNTSITGLSAHRQRIDTISENIEISADAPPDAPPGAPIDPARRDRALRRAALTPDLVATYRDERLEAGKSPITVRLSASPPAAAIWPLTHCSAATWSNRAKLASANSG